MRKNETYQSFPCTFTNGCWSFCLLSKIDWRRFDHSASNIMMYIFGDLKFKSKNHRIRGNVRLLIMNQLTSHAYFTGQRVTINSWQGLPYKAQIWTSKPQPVNIISTHNIRLNPIWLPSIAEKDMVWKHGWNFVPVILRFDIQTLQIACHIL